MTINVVLNFVMYVVCFLIGFKMGHNRGFTATMMKIWLMDKDAHNRILTEIWHVLKKRGVDVDDKLIYNLTRTKPDDITNIVHKNDNGG